MSDYSDDFEEDDEPQQPPICGEGKSGASGGVRQRVDDIGDRNCPGAVRGEE